MSKSSNIAVHGRRIHWLKPEVVFVVLALTAGLCMVFVNAPFEAPDEASHFWRAYHIYEGNFLTTKQDNLTGGWIPKSIACAHLPFENLVGHPENRVDKNALFQGLNQTYSDQPRIFMGMGFAGLYSPSVYIPQFLGIAVARAFDISALGTMYFGRITNLLFWIIGTFFAIRIAPTFKWVMVLVALLPMNLFLAASLSADAPAICYCGLLFALILRGMWKEDGLSKIHMLSITILCILLGLGKQPYVPLTGLVFLIPASRFGGLRNKILFCLVSIGLTLVAALIWSSILKTLYIPVHGANAPEQMALLKKQPWTFPIIAVRSFKIHFFGIAFSFIGTLGFLDTSLPRWIYLTYPFVLFAAALFDSDKVGNLTPLRRSWVGLICFGSWFLVMLSMYLTWTPPGESLIEGVQGRYFLPIAAPVLLTLFYNQHFHFSSRSKFAMFIAFFATVVLLVSCWVLYERYFAPV